MCSGYHLTQQSSPMKGLDESDGMQRQGGGTAEGTVSQASFVETFVGVYL